MTKCLLEDGTDVPMVQALHSEAWPRVIDFHSEDTAEAVGSSPSAVPHLLRPMLGR